MQSWRHSTPDSVKNYKKRFSADPHIYTVDLKGHGDMQFPESQVYCLAGFSDKIFEQMKYLETDKLALIRAIENYEF